MKATPQQDIEYLRSIGLTLGRIAGEAGLGESTVRDIYTGRTAKPTERAAAAIRKARTRVKYRPQQSVRNRTHDGWPA